MQEFAKKQTKSISNPTVETEVIDNDVDNENEPDTNNSRSISEIANLLKNRSSEKGDK